MRRLFLVLMIALLPLRGWVGDVMAMEMASRTTDATISVANYVYSTRTTGQFGSENVAQTPAECPEHAAMAFGPAAESTGAIAHAAIADTGNDIDNGHCNTCGTCQICHTLAMASALTWMPPDFIPQARPAASSIRFASALAALNQKPPIS